MTRSPDDALNLAAARRDIKHRQEVVEQRIARARQVLSHPSEYTDEEYRDQSNRLLDLEIERGEILPSRRYWTGMSRR